MTRELRKKKTKGLILANGGVLTHEHAIVLSSEPRTDDKSYPEAPPLPHDMDDVVGPPIQSRPEGSAYIEVRLLSFRYGTIVSTKHDQTYTVDWGRDGQPKLGHVVARLTASGQRFLANHGDQETLNFLASTEHEPIGKTGTVRSGTDGKNNFFISVGPKL